MSATNPSKLCQHCKKIPETNPDQLNACSKCKITSYCDRDCQRKDLEKHKYLCKQDFPVLLQGVNTKGLSSGFI